MVSKRTIREIQYSPETIKISLFLEPYSIDSVISLNWFDQTKNPASELQGSVVQTVTSPVKEFATAGMAPKTLELQTFSLSIPNFIHKARARNLSKGRRKH